MPASTRERMHAAARHATRLHRQEAPAGAHARATRGRRRSLLGVLLRAHPARVQAGAGALWLRVAQAVARGGGRGDQRGHRHRLVGRDAHGRRGADGTPPPTPCHTRLVDSFLKSLLTLVSDHASPTPRDLQVMFGSIYFEAVRLIMTKRLLGDKQVVRRQRAAPILYLALSTSLPHFLPPPFNLPP
eukprot:6208688-Pleurochrysis_carterae.AAC.1